MKPVDKEQVDKLLEEFSGLEEVEAIALGGSRAGEHFDEKSDYDIYVYQTSPIEEKVRRNILGKYCDYMEIGNRYWECEDDCTLKNGVDIEVLYRNLDDLKESIANVVEEYQASNGYTTCLWDNLLKCKILYDEYGRLERMKRRFTVPYPDKLRRNIVTRNWNLLLETMPAYTHQIEKAILRGDKVSILHRKTAFLESYFDILFALNRLTHPGEKRLMEFCMKNCSELPANFEENLNRLFDDLYGHTERVNEDLQTIALELKKILKLRNSLIFT
ncbi:MAG: DUF4037 domain-containing protein [Lachnospiraceae bacterium]|nr:DUF4037 domain-containing protein [Lachnospiraceae bacterium]